MIPPTLGDEGVTSGSNFGQARGEHVSRRPAATTCPRRTEVYLAPWPPPDPPPLLIPPAGPPPLSPILISPFLLLLSSPSHIIWDCWGSSPGSPIQPGKCRAPHWLPPSFPSSHRSTRRARRLDTNGELISLVLRRIVRAPHLGPSTGLTSRHALQRASTFYSSFSLPV
jgi:hypothetical protein